MKKKEKPQIPIWERANLTIDEASVYLWFMLNWCFYFNNDQNYGN